MLTVVHLSFNKTRLRQLKVSFDFLPFYFRCNVLNTDLDSEILKKSANVLERFKTSITQYITWWTRMKMSMEQQANSTEELKKFYSQVRKQNVAQKWEKLSTDFQEYSNKVTELAVLGSCTSYLTFIAILRCGFCKTNILVYFSKCRRLGQVRVAS